jgi:hypothetical protein
MASTSRFLASTVLLIAAFVAGFSMTLAKRGTSVRMATFVSSPRRIVPNSVATMVAADPDSAYCAALEKIGSRPDSETQYDDILKVLLQWAAVDPATALGYVQKHYDPRHRNSFLYAMLAQWAEMDGRAALDWVTTYLPHDYTQYDAVLSTIGRNNPAAAWLDAQQLAVQEDKANAQSIYASALRGIVYAGNYAQAAGLIENLQMPPGEEKYDLSSLLAGQWGLYEPAKAAQWALTLPDDNSLYGRQALVSLGVSWSQSDPQAAANFAMQLPSGVARQNMLATALDSWAADNPGQAATWINQYPPDPDLDMVVRSLSTSPQLIDSNPALAIDWADSIFDEAIKGQTLNIIMNQWTANDPAAANQYLNNLTGASGSNNQP